MLLMSHDIPFEFSPHSVICFFTFKLIFSVVVVNVKCCIFRLMCFTVDISAKTLIAILMSVTSNERVCRRLATSVICTNVLCPPDSSRFRRWKMKRPTLRSATNPTSRHKRQPASQWGTAPILPCLQWRPRSVDRGSLDKCGAQEGG